MVSVFGIDIEALRKNTETVKRELLVMKYGEQVKAVTSEAVSRGRNTAEIRVAKDDVVSMIEALRADGFAIEWNENVPDLIVFSW